MIVIGWNNGDHQKSGAGYSVKLNADDRDRFFKRDWETIILEMEGSSDSIRVNVAKSSFWGTTCRELINVEIGRWLIRNRLSPWKKGHPPRLLLMLIKSNRFLLKKQDDGK
ncbi:MAG: hypothetical protein WBW94_13230 [Anaerolineales bacterium]